MKPLLSLLLFVLPAHLFSQEPILASGPVQLHTTTTSVKAWFLFRDARHIEIKLAGSAGLPIYSFSADTLPRWNHHVPVLVSWEGLSPGKEYDVVINLDGRFLEEREISVRTFGNPTGDEWSFLTGSCAFQPQGIARILRNGPMEIFKVMIGEPAEFMLWLGDNYYYLYGEWNSEARMMKKQVTTRLSPPLAAFMQTLPNYQLWDDHDYGPNDSYGDWEGKETSFRVLKRFWANPYYGTETAPGNFCHFRFRNAEFFLLDDRFYKEHEEDPDAFMLGKEQMRWLKVQLAASTATWKFVCNGSQVLNQVSPSERWTLYPEERKELFDHILQNKISGILFLSGDRHWSEILSDQVVGCYPFYDFTCSPLTSWPRRFHNHDPEENNPLRVPGKFYRSWNYGKITLSGSGKDQQCRIEVMDHEGKLMFDHVISISEISFP